MTDRYHSLTVALDDDLRVDDAQRLIDAIRQLRGVADVAGNVADVGDWVAERRAQQRLQMRLWDVLRGDDDAA